MDEKEKKIRYDWTELNDWPLFHSQLSLSRLGFSKDQLIARFKKLSGNGQVWLNPNDNKVEKETLWGRVEAQLGRNCCCAGKNVIMMHHINNNHPLIPTIHRPWSDPIIYYNIDGRPLKIKIVMTASAPLLSTVKREASEWYLALLWSSFQCNLLGEDATFRKLIYYPVTTRWRLNQYWCCCT